MFKNIVNNKNVFERNRISTADSREEKFGGHEKIFAVVYCHLLISSEMEFIESGKVVRLRGSSGDFHLKFSSRFRRKLLKARECFVSGPCRNDVTRGWGNNQNNSDVDLFEVKNRKQFQEVIRRYQETSFSSSPHHFWTDPTKSNKTDEVFSIKVFVNVTKVLRTKFPQL